MPIGRRNGICQKPHPPRPLIRVRPVDQRSLLACGLSSVLPAAVVSGVVDRKDFPPRIRDVSQPLALAFDTVVAREILIQVTVLNLSQNLAPESTKAKVKAGLTQGQDNLWHSRNNKQLLLA
ncbi:hypothetical protein BJ508DRAFT_33480 [Ascobolus immersus RN42]|uniref:Uncharacterized protein n=1 Tax=Ascobolus immersus RN42 TaxID=1160509 RepID=A0A3N4HLB8_ASCIM|nr:hypothetical protein BJ508DRAFT_33480 [Ascobolus immersus RN42]